MQARFKPGLNEILSGESEEVSSLSEERIAAIIRDCATIEPSRPFVYIRNYLEAFQRLARCPLWLAYGGVRTASTYSFLILDILMASLSTRYIVGWEGDYQSPLKFIELVKNSKSLEAGILKIHRTEDACNAVLSAGLAKAVVTTRDYPSIASSWVRMRNNKRSPFYRPKTTEKDIIEFVASEIKGEIAKSLVPNCIFVSSDRIERDPYNVVRAICVHLGLDVCENSIQATLESVTRVRVQQMQRSISATSAGHDSESFLHYEHVRPDGYTDEKTKELVWHEFGSRLDRHGYLMHDQ